MYLITWKADEKFEQFKREFRAEQHRIERRLKADYKKNTDRLLEGIEEDINVTKGILEKFHERPDADDPSGIPSEFLRDE